MRFSFRRAFSPTRAEAVPATMWIALALVLTAAAQAPGWTLSFETRCSPGATAVAGCTADWRPATAACLGVKPQAEAPHSAPDAPRGALRRRLRRRTTSSARARTQRHRLVAARARAGPTWESERSSSVTSRRATKAARAQVEGKWRGNWEPLRPPTRLEPAAAGRRRAAHAGASRKKR